MTLSELVYVVAVADHQNFVKASNHCFVTQPTLSMQIKKLEEELGVVIFDRSRQPVVPTQAGEAIIEQARTVLREANRLEEIARETQAFVGGEYKLGIIPTLAATVLPLFLQSFHTRYPAVKLVIQEVQTEVMLEMLAQDKLDSGIAATPLLSKEITERPIFYEPFFLYASPQHPFAKKKKIHEVDLAGQEVWLLNEGHCFRNQVVELCGLQQRKETPSNLRFESGNLNTLMRLVEQHFGMTLLPQLVVHELSPEKQKAMVRPFAAPVPMREVSLIHRRQYVKERITNLLYDEILSGLPKNVTTKKDAQSNLLNPF